jgi:hypothetical protein
MRKRTGSHVSYGIKANPGESGNQIFTVFFGWKGSILIWRATCFENRAEMKMPRVWGDFSGTEISGGTFLQPPEIMDGQLVEAKRFESFEVIDIINVFCPPLIVHCYFHWFAALL